jgi:hypothetical protein
LGNSSAQLAEGGRAHLRVHRVATAAFWRTFIHEGKISPSPVKLQCALQLSGQTH